MKIVVIRTLVCVLILSLSTPAFCNQVMAEGDTTRMPIYSLPEVEFLEQSEYLPPSPEVIAQTQAQVQSFDCSTVTDISQNHCEALVALYESTNGAGWIDNSNWLVTSTVNDWYGIDAYSPDVMFLDLGSNNLTGTIPPELGNLTNLNSLELRGNQLTGSIPPELGNLSNLRMFLFLDYNQLTGSIPSELSNLTNLETLSIVGNQLTGPIPPELGSLKNLKHLYLDNNRLSGSIPPELGNMTNLLDLYLGSNQLTGYIPPELGSLSNLWGLSLDDNQLSGSIPPELGSLANLIHLDLSSNQLSGAIPSALGSLKFLEYLCLDDNLLRGPIPPEIGNLINLVAINLRANRLSGDVPASFTKLVNLCGPDNAAPPCFGYYETDLGYNHLNVPATESVVKDFLAIKDPDWQLTQVIFNKGYLLPNCQAIVNLRSMRMLTISTSQ